ncbi:response regulator [Paenibacillus apiarius]|uniref:response regulator n=1 Tax=Paenibacillus apiarius TaxID=46240 RepID=UPI003B3B5AAF
MGNEIAVDELHAFKMIAETINRSTDLTALLNNVLRGLRFFLKMQPDIEVIGEALNGIDAIRIAETWKPDVVVMDLMLPQMNGIEATQHIRQHLPDTKVLVLTSYFDKDHVVPAIQAGANGYLMKDIMPDEGSRQHFNENIR